MSKKVALVDADYDGKILGIIKMLQSEETFKDYNFEGSAIRSIIRVLALFSSDASLNANLLFNERFVHTAEIRKNVVSSAQNLGYRPNSRTAAKLKALVKVNLESPVPTPVLKKTLSCIGVKDGQTYTFVPTTDYVGVMEGNTAVFSGVELLQGSWKTESYDVSDYVNVFTTTIEDSTNVDSKTVRVYVNENGVFEEYALFNNILQLGAENKLFYMDYNVDGGIVLELGDGKLSYKPSNGVVYVQYVVTSGVSGNDISRVTPIGVVEGSSDISIELDGLSYGGSDEESIDSIRVSARGAYGSGGLAVTEEQYLPICKRLFPSYMFSVWGGEKNVPPKNGYVMICGVDQTGQRPPQQEIDYLFEQLKTVNVGSITPRWVDSQTIRLIINLSVYWVPSVTSLDSTAVSSKVAADVDTFFKENLVGFNRSFEPTDLITYVKAKNNFLNGGYVATSITRALNIYLGNLLNVAVHKPIKPSSVVVTGLMFGLEERQVVDNGVGDLLLNGSVVGSVDYPNGTLQLTLNAPLTLNNPVLKFDIDGVDQSYTTTGNESFNFGGVSVNPIRRN